MQYEIDYLPVGTGEKGGDAIVFRYGDFSDPTKQNVVVIDGGTKDSGKLLSEHIKKYYNTEFVDLVVASHLHGDHVSGLTEIVNNLKVNKIAMHCPWDYTNEIKKMTNTQNTLGRLESKLEKSLKHLSELHDLAESKKIPIIQPFQGEQLIDGLFVLSPSREYYNELLANFGITPEVKTEHKIESLLTKAKDVISWVAEELHIETLSDDYDDTNPENNSSLVLLFAIDGKKFLFTGDAGKDALGKAITFAETNNVSLLNLDFFDVPHHGSKRNIGPSILNKLKPKHAFISCPPKGDPKHPSRKVINAFIRRGCNPCATKTQTINHNFGTAPTRPGWVTITPESFYNQVED